jgi:hypothetical protein
MRTVDGVDLHYLKQLNQTFPNRPKVKAELELYNTLPESGGLLIRGIGAAGVNQLKFGTDLASEKNPSAGQLCGRGSYFKIQEEIGAFPSDIGRSVYEAENGAPNLMPGVTASMQSEGLAMEPANYVIIDLNKAPFRLDRQIGHNSTQAKHGAMQTLSGFMEDNPDQPTVVVTRTTGKHTAVVDAFGDDTAATIMMSEQGTRLAKEPIKVTYGSRTEDGIPRAVGRAMVRTLRGHFAPPEVSMAEILRAPLQEGETPVAGMAISRGKVGLYQDPNAPDVAACAMRSRENAYELAKTTRR